jgi:alcohol dehydrogenase class IV
MPPFDFLTAGRIRFGRGRADTAVDAVRGFGARVLLVRGRSVAWVDGFSRALSEAGCQVTEVVCTREPDLPTLEAALALARDAGAEVVVAVGGGAVIDLGKAAAALVPSDSAVLDHLEGVGHGKPLSRDPLPFVAIPTTAGTGAEVTKNAVIAVPEAARKVSLRDDRMLPDLAIVDPNLMDHAPRSVTLSSGLDAVVQVIEPYLCNRSNPLTDALTRSAIPIGLKALNRLARAEDAEAREQMAFVSLCGGLALANSGLGAVHGLAGVIGGRLGAPHGLVCGRLLGPVLLANSLTLRAAGVETSRFDEVSAWLSGGLGVSGQAAFEELSALLDRWEVARLGEWITPDTDLVEIAKEAAGSSSMRANPCVLQEDDLEGIMRAAT